ncbi:rab-GTPase-TBC domain-containing protein [Dichotomocladium elegans]|nr:rab-GTPase-TBC domain-containing protein [Dichotomocladium elegans]
MIADEMSDTATGFAFKTSHLTRSFSPSSDTRSSKFSLDDTRSHTSSMDTTEKGGSPAPETKPAIRQRRARGLTVTQHSLPIAAKKEEEEQQLCDLESDDVEESEEEDDESIKQSADTADDLANIHDQIHGLLVQGRDDDDDDDDDDDYSFQDAGQSSPKSLHSTTSSLHSYVSSASNYDLLLARLGNQQGGGFGQTQLPQEEDNDVDTKSIALSEYGKTGKAKDDDDTDWDFWAKVISDIKGVTKSALSHHIQKGGIPDAIRGTVWQLLVKAKDNKLETTYMELLKQESVYEKAILRDLPRTFPENDYFKAKDGRDALFNVAKAYSIYDKDVGYCQGILYLTAPLLLNMPEEEAFCVLVQMMYQFDLRGHFTAQPDMLSVRLYQLTNLVSDQLPHIHRHFEFQGVHANMYASSWFVSLFAQRLPLNVVFRIYDAFLSEGLNTIFRVALALLDQNQATILALEYDHLLRFLKTEIGHLYQDAVNPLMQDAAKINIPQRRLDKLAKQYLADTARSNSEAEAIDALRRQNKALTETLRKLQNALNDLNREHDTVAKELIESKMEIARIHDENDALRQQSFDLKRALETLPNEVEGRVKEEMEVLSTKNTTLIERNTMLEEQLTYMEQLVIEMKVKFLESENERDSLERRLTDLKRVMG